MVSSVMTGGIERVTPNNTNRSLSHVNSLCIKTKKNANKPKYLLRTTKGLWQPIRDHSEDGRYLKSHTCTNATSNYSLAKKKHTKLTF